jgi:hypothetical protein
MSNAMKMARLIVDQIRWAEINEAWGYMERLLLLVREMGGRVMRMEDPRFRWRSDYIVSFHASEAHPVTR